MHKLGAPTTLSAAEENTLAEWIIESAKRGFPQTLLSIRQGGANISKQFAREKTFKNQLPTYKWAKAFLKRHPELTQRKPERLSGASATVRPEDLLGYHYCMTEFFESNNLTSVLADPRRMIGGDETSFEYNPIPRKVVVAAGSKNALKIDTAPSKVSTSVMHTVR